MGLAWNHKLMYVFKYLTFFLNLKVPFEVLESLSSNKTLFNLILENYPNLLLCRSSSVNQMNNVGKAQPEGRMSSNNKGSTTAGHRPETPPLVMKMKLKQSKKCNSMGSGVLSPLESLATSPPQNCTADNSPERHPMKPHQSTLKRQFSTTQSSYLKSLPYHRSVGQIPFPPLSLLRNIKPTVFFLLTINICIFYMYLDSRS